MSKERGMGGGGVGGAGVKLTPPEKSTVKKPSVIRIKIENWNKNKLNTLIKRVQTATNTIQLL